MAAFHHRPVHAVPDQPSRLTRRQRILITEAQKLVWLLDEARQELADACALENVELVSRASRRVYSIGALAFENASKLDKGPRLL